MEEMINHKDFISEPLFFNELLAKTPAAQTPLGNKFLKDFMLAFVDTATGLKTIDKVERFIERNQTILSECQRLLNTQGPGGDFIQVANRYNTKSFLTRSQHIDRLRSQSNIFVHKFALFPVMEEPIIYRFERIIDEFYKLDNEISNLQIRDIISPKSEESSSPQEKEQRRLSRIWKQWSNTVFSKNDQFLQSAINPMFFISSALRLVSWPLRATFKTLFMAPLSNGIRMLRYPRFYRPIVLSRGIFN
jgi:hypothetical protein